MQHIIFMDDVKRVQTDCQPRHYYKVLTPSIIILSKNASK